MGKKVKKIQKKSKLILKKKPQPIKQQKQPTGTPPILKKKGRPRK